MNESTAETKVEGSLILKRGEETFEITGVIGQWPWITTEGGEGMAFDADKFFEMVLDFYRKEF